MIEINCNALPKIKDKQIRAVNIEKSLERIYPNAECSLSYENDPFKLLVMARLSAQCTDKRVNEVSKNLFKVFPSVHDFANADIAEIENLIKSCGLYKMKAKNIKEMSCQIIEKHGGNVPHTKKELLALSGVGIKIANLMMGDVFGDSCIVPDTHCMRICYRLKLISKPEPLRCIEELSAVIPKEKQSDFCHRLVLFGRDICRAQNPDCSNCPFNKENN